MKNILEKLKTKVEDFKKPLSYTDSLHRIGRIFTVICLLMIGMVPVVYCLVAKVSPQWKIIGNAWSFIVGYIAIGLVEAVSYAPILGVGGQYLAFITGNISNLKLPCSLNTQTILDTKQGSEEQEIISTISIAVSSIVTTVIILIGLIPLGLLGGNIVNVLKPVSPYVIPAIFGGLGIVLLSRYFKQTVIPFAVLIIVCVVMFLVGSDPGQATMITVGMAVSIISGTILYIVSKKKEKKAAAIAPVPVERPTETPVDAASDEVAPTEKATQTEEENSIEK